VSRIIGPNLKLLVSLYANDRRDGFNRYRAVCRFFSGLRSMVVGRLRYR
jgi:hypothetical protein